MTDKEFIQKLEKAWQKIKDKEWAEFLDWLYKTHSITKDWTPNKTSVELWEEFRSSKIK